MESNNSSFVQAAIPKFDGHYDHWAMLMENFLHSKEYWDLIENGMSMEVTQRTEPGSVSMVGAKEGQHKLSEDQAEAQRKLIEGQKLKDLKVKNYLFQAIDRCLLCSQQ
jgi:hypothetical protein